MQMVFPLERHLRNSVIPLLCRALMLIMAHSGESSRRICMAFSTSSLEKRSVLLSRMRGDAPLRRMSVK